MKTLLDIVQPIAIGKSYLHSLYCFDSMIERIETVWGSLLGTSIPMVPRPGIGAMMRMPSAASFRAISFSRFLILDILTPSAGIISKSVIVGPTHTSICFMSISKLFRASVIRRLFSSCS